MMGMSLYLSGKLYDRAIGISIAEGAFIINGSRAAHLSGLRLASL